MAKDEVPGISDETKSILEDHVKKGKARKFFLVFKGPNIRTLVVFKKGKFGPKVLQAKKDGFKGEVAYGVVTGSGKNLFFQLAGNDLVAAAMKVDSFVDKPPTKRAKLRQFLADNELEFKPSYHLITDVSAAPDPEAEADLPIAPPPPGSEVADDDDQESTIATDESSNTPAEPSVEPTSESSVEPQAESQTQSQTAPPTQAEGKAASTGNDAEQFMSRLKELKPSLDKVIAAQGPISQQVKLSASEAALFARKGDYGSALTKLEETQALVEQALKSVDVDQPQTNDSGTSESGTLAAKLAEALKKLKPLIDRVINADPGRKGELHASIAQIAGEIKNKQFEQAKQNITDFATQLKSLLASIPATPPSEAADRSQEFAERSAQLEPLLIEAQKADREKATKMGAVWDYAQQQAQEKNFENAFKALDRLESAIGGAVGSAASATSTAPSSTNPDVDFANRLKALVSRIKEVVGTPVGDEAKLRASEAAVFARKKEFEQANLLLDQVESILDGRTPIESTDANSEQAVPSSADEDQPLTGLAAALATWKSARDDVRKQLSLVKEAVLDTGDPDADDVVIELDSIYMNLPAEPNTMERVNDLLRYLQTDDVITEAEEVPPYFGTLDIRKPLLEAAEQLKAQLA